MRNFTPRTYLEKVLDWALRNCCEHLNPDRPDLARAIVMAAAMDNVERASRKGMTVKDTRVRVFKQGENVEVENL